jgi:DNA modification methylase
MKTLHRIYWDSIENCDIQPETIDLIVTSPPYPMVEMWDGLFIKKQPRLKEMTTGEIMHDIMLNLLKPVWKTCHKVLKPGGFICVNIGDATRKIGESFRLYDNHSPITQYLQNLGFEQLPRIIWRKQTNAPNKFMGSGTLPLRAYVTLEHEFILIFRKGPAKLSQVREENRKRSSIFWEERNQWYSDVWDFKGTRQSKNGKRTAAFPFELPHRLINMFSIQGDVVVDPFLGSGTTMSAAMANARSSICFEINTDLKKTIRETMKETLYYGISMPSKRVENHKSFVKTSKCKYTSRYGKVKTRQEVDIAIPVLKGLGMFKKDRYVCEYNFYK